MCELSDPEDHSVCGMATITGNTIQLDTTEDVADGSDYGEGKFALLSAF